jgi:hypothetical protein
MPVSLKFKEEIVKNRIRKWLGIDSIEETLRQRTKPTQEELRRMVGEAISDALEGKSDEELSFWYPMPIRIKNILTSALEKASVDTASKTAKWEVQNKIGTEAFIDEVVARIQRKQLQA